MLAALWFNLMDLWIRLKWDLVIVSIISKIKTTVSFYLMIIFKSWVCSILRLKFLFMIFKPNILIVVLYLVPLFIILWRRFALFPFIYKNWTLIFKMLQIINFQISCPISIITIKRVIHALRLRRIWIRPSSIRLIITRRTVIWGLNELS